LPVDVELQAVIAAHEIVAGELALGQRRGAMATAVFQRGDLARAVAE